MKTIILFLIFVLAASPSIAACGWILWESENPHDSPTKKQYKYIYAKETKKECEKAKDEWFHAMTSARKMQGDKVITLSIPGATGIYSYINKNNVAYDVILECLPSDFDPRPR